MTHDDCRKASPVKCCCYQGAVTPLTTNRSSSALQESKSTFSPVLLRYLNEGGGICAGNLFTGKTLLVASLASSLHLNM